MCKFILDFIKIACCLLFVFCIYCAADENKPQSNYVNKTPVAASGLDENFVPIAPKTKFKTIWDNVNLKGITRSDIPHGTIKKLTVIKFHYAGAWIAWSDSNGYHEAVNADYIPWRHFPDNIKEHYEKYYLADWKVIKSKKPFMLRTPRYSRSGKEMEPKSGKMISRRSPSGVLCPEIYRNLFVPFSELPHDISLLCGFWQNEAFIPDAPVMERKEISFDDEVLFVVPRYLRYIRRIKDGTIVRITVPKGSKNNFKDILIEPFRGRFQPNHRSDLHVFKDGKDEKKCLKCGLTDHINQRYFNYMFDRQSRSPCSVKSLEYALIKKGEKKIGRMTFPVYEFVSDYDKKYPADSKKLFDSINGQGGGEAADEEDAG